jgi:transcriptional regulator with XRE-family HTH domain
MVHRLRRIAVPPLDPALAIVLRRLRIDRGLSQEFVAHKAGIAYSTLAKVELGRSSPAWGTVRAIADALNVTMSELGAAIDAEAR